MYFSKWVAYSVVSGLVIIFNFLREFVSGRTLRLHKLDAPFERSFHIRFEPKAPREIVLGLRRPAHSQPEHPAVGVDLSIIRIERESPVVIGEGGIVIAPRIAGVRAVIVILREARVQFNGAAVVGDRAVEIAARKKKIAAIAVRRRVSRIEL